MALSAQQREVPKKGAPVLKIIKQVAPGRHEAQALRYFDKAAIVAALDSDAVCSAAFDLLAASTEVDVREAMALARARDTGRLQ